MLLLSTIINIIPFLSKLNNWNILIKEIIGSDI